MPTAYQSLILAEASLVSYWQMEELSGTTGADSKGSLPLTYQSGVTLGQAGLNGSKCPLFNGSLTTNYAATAAPPSTLPASNNDRTLECWIKTSSPQTDPNSSGYVGICGYGRGLSPGELYSLYCKTDGTTILVGDLGTNLLFATPGFTNGIWHHLVATYASSGGALILYYDGVNVATKSLVENMINIANPFWIGRVASNNGPFTGLIDEVAMYGGVLSPSSVLAHYNAGIAAAAAAHGAALLMGL